jgi:branched-chain amino acid aminotransferase
MEKNGKLYTPKKGHIMPGITRSVIMDICKSIDVEVEETEFSIEDLKQAESAFFTGTAAEVVVLKSIDEYEFPLEWKQSLGYRLMHLYKQEVLGTRELTKHLSKAV